MSKKRLAKGRRVLSGGIARGCPAGPGRVGGGGLPCAAQSKGHSFERETTLNGVID